MGTGLQISFLIDEHLPTPVLLPILEDRGHLVTPIQVRSGDPAILKIAEETAAVIVTADSWFLHELFRFPVGHRRCYQAAGVIQVPESWAAARTRISSYLPIIEAVYALRRTQPDHRVAIDLSQREIRIWEP
jgi:hypothetical protein